MATTIKLEVKTGDGAEKPADPKKKGSGPTSSASGMAAGSASGSAAQPIEILGALDDDDVEAALLGGHTIFLAVNSTTEPESEADTSIRMKLYQQLMLATPHHTHKTRNCALGDCYQFVKLILTNVTVTGQTPYMQLMALGDVKFTPSMSISDLVADLQDVQMAAERLMPGTISTSVMKGALLAQTQRDTRFAQLATKYSQKSCSKSFDEIVAELTVHEDNFTNAARHKTHQQAHALVEPCDREPMSALPSVFLEQVAALLARAPANLLAQPLVEDCRNYARGRCNRSASECKFSHAQAGNSKPSGGGAGRGKANKEKQILCYNCQKLGTHLANECTAPRVERPARKSNTNGEQANVANETAEPPSSSVAEFMAQFLKLSAQMPKSDTDHGAFMMIEVEVDEPSGTAPDDEKLETHRVAHSSGDEEFLMHSFAQLCLEAGDTSDAVGENRFRDTGEARGYEAPALPEVANDDHSDILANRGIEPLFKLPANPHVRADKQMGKAYVPAPLSQEDRLEFDSHHRDADERDVSDDDFPELEVSSDDEDEVECADVSDDDLPELESSSDDESEAECSDDEDDDSPR